MESKHVMAAIHVWLSDLRGLAGHSLVWLFLVTCILLAGCGGPKIRIDDRVEPFLIDRPIISQVTLRCEFDKLENTGPHFIRLPLSETFCEKSEEAIVKGGIAQSVLKTNSGDSRVPTLRTVARITYDGNTGMAVVKSIVFTLLFPLLPFMEHTVTYTISSDLFVIQSQRSAQVGTINSTLYLTRTLFNSFNETEVIPLIAEDVSWKIALELKRHPDWLRPPSTATTP